MALRFGEKFDGGKLRKPGALSHAVRLEITLSQACLRPLGVRERMPVNEGCGLSQTLAGDKASLADHQRTISGSLLAR